MRLRLIRWCRQFAIWLEGPYPEKILALARCLVQSQAAFPDRSGEAKRHQVYAALIKAFPETEKRQLSRIIEAALDVEVPA